MKYTILLILVSFSVMASNWVPVEKIAEHSSQAYQLQSSCPGKCLDVGDEPQAVTLGFVAVKDNYLKSDEQECFTEEDCDAKFLALVCAEDDYEKIKNYDLLQVYCSKFVGTVLVKDLAGFSAYKAGVAAQVQMEAGLSFAKKLRECGGRVMDLMLVRNQPKNLSTEQVKQLVATYASIQGLLSSGSLNSAKEEIAEVTADGVLVTNGDKAALTAEINKCLGL